MLWTLSTTLCNQRTPKQSPPKPAPKPSYSHVVQTNPQPHDPGKLSPDLSRVQSCDTLTPLGSHDLSACDPGKVSHDLPRDWSLTQSYVLPQSPDRICFRHMPSLLIDMWKTMGMINKSTSK